MKKALQGSLVVFVVVFGAVWILSLRSPASEIAYGLSFSKLHSDELGLNWKDVYLTLLDDLGVQHLRLSAHWPMVEPRDGVYDFSVLDYQIAEAAARGADVILAVGRRAPGWPECHVPKWASALSPPEREVRQLAYMGAVINRYKDAPNLRYWQVENEPYMNNFANSECGDLDEPFFKKELATVRSLDSDHSILVTDSGEFGKWYKARRAGDIFGTSMYLYVWYDPLGHIRYPIGAWFFRAKQNIFDLLAPKKTILIELGLEPWLNRPIASAPLDEQIKYMGMDNFREILDIAQRSDFSEQYLWGGEWWYYMGQNGHPEFWNAAKELYAEE